MEINNFSEFPEGIFLDYFLNRISKEEFKSTFEAPFLAKELYNTLFLMIPRIKLERTYYY